MFCLLCLRCIPSLPTSVLRLAAVLIGAFTVFWATAMLATAAPHTVLGNSMDEGMRKEMSAVGNSLADVLTSTANAGNNTCLAYEHEAKGRCSLTARIQGYLVHIGSDVYRQHTLDIDQIKGVWLAIGVGFLAFITAAGIFGLLVIYGAVASKPSYLCPYQTLAILVYLASLITVVLIGFRLVETQASLKDFWTERGKLGVVGRLLKILGTITLILGVQIYLLHKLSARIRKERLAKIRSSSPEAATSSATATTPLVTINNHP